MPTVPTCAVRETASLGIMGAPRVPPLNPSETIVLPELYNDHLDCSISSVTVELFSGVELTDASDRINNFKLELKPKRMSFNLKQNL